MNSSLDFIWDPVEDKFNLEFLQVEDYDMNTIILLYRQMVLFIRYRDVLYANAINNAIDISRLIQSIPNRNDKKFMKRVIGNLIDMGYADRVDTNQLRLNQDQYSFEKHYLLPGLENFVLDLPKNIYNLTFNQSPNTTTFQENLKKYLAVMRRMLMIIQYLQQGLCMVSQPICPFLDSLGVMATGHLNAYRNIQSTEFYGAMVDAGSRFAEFYKTMKPILMNPEIDSYNTIIITLGPGSEINEYLPDYALEAETLYQRNVLIFPVEPEYGGEWKALSRKEILRGYGIKRGRLFPNVQSPGRLNVADVINHQFSLVSITNDNKYYSVATTVLIKTGFNPLMADKIVILQCGIAPTGCNNIFLEAIKYGMKVDVYITVRGANNLMYKVINKGGGVKYDEESGGKMAGWKQMKQFMR